jgi:predicted transcriptional regulator
MQPQPKRAPKVRGSNARMLGTYLDGATLARLEDVAYTRQRFRNFIAATAIRLGLPLVEKLKEFPEPPASGGKSKPVGIYLDGATADRVEALAEKRERAPSRIAVAAIRLGLKEVKKLYPAVRKSKKATAKKSPARAASKEPRASAGRKSSARAGAK